jgi:DNA-binding response OmpR family regulator
VARILIVEPHPDIRRLLELVVRRLGHEPVVRRDGQPEPEAIDAGVIEPGDGSGLLVARQLRARGLPVVLTSIYPADAEARSLEPAAYLVKPFPLHRLERALTAVLPIAA